MTDESSDLEQWLQEKLTHRRSQIDKENDPTPEGDTEQ